MKLDPRIKSVSDILTCFDTERAKAFIGENGFFANEINSFGSGASYCRYGALTNVLDDQPTSPYLKGSHNSYSFFLPESSLKPEEKNYRPYTPQEFCNEFNIGERVIFRKKGDPESGQDLILQGLWYRQLNGAAVTHVRLGSYLYALEELFNGYERRRPYKMDFVPFGVEVEE